MLCEQIGERGFEAIRVADVLVDLHPQRWLVLSLEQPPNDAQTLFESSECETNRVARDVRVRWRDAVIAVAMDQFSHHPVRPRASPASGSA